MCSGDAALLPKRLVEVDHRHRQRWQAHQQVILGQHRDRRTILEQVAQAFGRVGRVDRHIAGPGLENRQQPHQGVEPAPGNDRHAVIGANTQLNQVVRQDCSLLIQFGISQLTPQAHRSQCLRLLGGAGGDTLVQSQPLRVVGLVGIEAFEQQLALSVGQDRQLLEQRLWALLQGVHQLFQGGPHVVADPLPVDLRAGQQGQAKIFAEVIDTQGQRIVGALLRAERGDALPGRDATGTDGNAVVPIVEQGTEQWRRHLHCAATLGQR